MAKVIFAYTATTILVVVGWGTALASDRELQAILARVACVPERVVPHKLSATVVVYEVICKSSGRAVQVECLGTECRLLARPRDDDEE
jgi:hypothetical protein